MTRQQEHAPSLLHWLGEAHEGGRELVGGKAASLERLQRLGHRTPSGFCVTIEAWQRYVDGNGLATMLHRLENRLPDEDARVTVQALATEHPLPLDLHVALVDGLASLGARDPGELLAVRSSALAEDGIETSFAGLHDTELGVHPGEVEDALRRCWSSLWSERAVAYRDTHGLTQRTGGMGVVVQRLLPAEAAAVAFTIDPVSGSRDFVVLNAVAGLGEQLMSGVVSGDAFEVDRGSLEARAVDTNGNGPHACISLDDAAGLAEVALEVERSFGMPVDVEAALWDGRWHLLQARPVTTRG